MDIGGCGQGWIYRGCVDGWLEVRTGPDKGYIIFLHAPLHSLTHVLLAEVVREVPAASAAGSVLSLRGLRSLKPCAEALRLPACMWGVEGGIKGATG